MAVMEAIATTYLEANAASVAFDLNSSPGNTYEHLQLRGMVLSAHPFGASDYTLNLATGGGSADTSNNYSHFNMFGSATSEEIVKGDNTRFKIYTGQATGQSNEFSTYGHFVMDILDYRNPNKRTTVMVLTGLNDYQGSNEHAGLTGGLWENTGAVTKVEIQGSYQDLVRGSSFFLYGLKSAN